jgi:phenylpropionate dioxygenase-like ring-hydroxylating dioxygenase large terminal subunit
VTQQSVQWQRPVDDPAITGLVQEGRVHSAVYTDPELFELELARIFHSTWVYVGHASEVPSPGDYQTRTIGRTPVIMVRGPDQKVRVLINRCRHRGAQVCETNSGNSKFFRCWYHGWVYDSTGALVDVPGRDGYGKGFDTAVMGLMPVPRVGNYRGFVFASLSPEGKDLETWLGGAAAAIDIMVDASPIGELHADGGTYKTEYRGNWKLVGMDGYHTPFVHASIFNVTQKRSDSAGGLEYFEMTKRGHSSDDGVRAREFGNGHTMLDYRGNRLWDYEKRCNALKGIPGGAEYIEAMHKTYGDERATLLISLSGDPHLGIFPNLQLIQNQIRIMTPLAPDRTIITMTAVRLGGVSDEINARRLRQQEYFYGPAGAGSPDDAEVFERVQRGMLAEANPWIDLSRGVERQQTDPDGSIAGLHSDEVPQRGMMREWLKLMTQAK